MATFKQRGTSWQAQIARLGVRLSATFDTKRQAQDWAATTEAEIVAGKHKAGVNPADKTLADAMEKYRDEVSIAKKGERWERVRINMLMRDKIADSLLQDLAQPDFADWRDRRLKQVSPASVRREWVLLSSICTIALKEWHWLDKHPMKGVKLPSPPASRDRLPTREEIDALKVALGYTEHECIGVGQRVAAAMLFSGETGMRASELCGLTDEDIVLSKSFCRVRDGKTSAAKRDVALSSEAIRILKQLDVAGSSVFGLTPTQIDANFRKAKKAAGIDDLHFHDFRHYAITRLAKKLTVLDLARMVGHRDIRMLQVYYNESAEEIAKLL